MRLGQRAAEDREVLAEDEDQPAVDRAVAGDDAVAEDALLADRRSPVDRWRDERVELDEGARVEQQLEPLARRQLARGVLALDALRAPAEQRSCAHRRQALEPFLFGRHAVSSLTVASRAVFAHGQWRSIADRAADQMAFEPPVATVDVGARDLSTESVNNSRLAVDNRGRARWTCE